MAASKKTKSKTTKTKKAKTTTKKTKKTSTKTKKTKVGCLSHKEDADAKVDYLLDKYLKNGHDVVVTRCECEYKTNIQNRAQLYIERKDLIIGGDGHESHNLREQWRGNATG